MNVIGHTRTFLSISVVLVASAVAAIAVFGFKQGIDFEGGTLWRIRVPGAQPPAADVSAILEKDLGIADPIVALDEANGSLLIRMASASEEDHQRFLVILTEKLPGLEELSFQSIGPSVGKELRTKSVVAIALVLVGISLYIAFAFRKVFRPVSSWKYGWVTLVTLFHDVAIPAGLLALLGRFLHVEIDGNFVVALLVVMGFSVHDTIVVFDRIRENLFLDRGKTDFRTIVNQSVNQTLARSVNTSLTLILVLLALYVAGPANLHYFILTLLVGVTTGVYSSLFVASPLLVVWHGLSSRNTART